LVYHPARLEGSNVSKTIAVLALAVLAQPSLAQELSEQTFEELYSYLVPKEKDLAWRKIPWRATLWEAVLEGQRLDRPILFWAMNGHPLGCT